jgi:DNA polymerase III gamma/tau subunit
MKNVLVLLLLLNTTDPGEISKYNRLKNKAEIAFEHGQFDIAATNYSMLYDTLSAEDPAIALNLAHSYYQLGDSANAMLKYQAAATSSDRKVKSVAYQQLGVMADKPETLNESLQYLKSALKADPTNEEARFNYEVVKKKLEQQRQNQDDQQNQDQQDKENNEDQENKDQQDQQNDQENQDQENQEQDNQEQQDQDQENQEQQDQEQQDGEQKEGEEQEQKEQQDQEGEKSEEQKNQEMSTKEKLEQMNISEEKAKMILEAMKNNEIQYIQQQRRKPTKAPESGKPDW